MRLHLWQNGCDAARGESIVDVRAFRRSKAADWRQLQSMIRHSRRGFGNADELFRFLHLYRQAANHSSTRPPASPSTK